MLVSFEVGVFAHVQVNQIKLHEETKGSHLFARQLYIKSKTADILSFHPVRVLKLTQH